MRTPGKVWPSCTFEGTRRGGAAKFNWDDPTKRRTWRAGLQICLELGSKSKPPFMKNTRPPGLGQLTLLPMGILVTVQAEAQPLLKSLCVPPAGEVAPVFRASRRVCLHPTPTPSPCRTASASRVCPHICSSGSRLPPLGARGPSARGWGHGEGCSPHTHVRLVLLPIEDSQQRRVLVPTEIQRDVVDGCDCREQRG